MKKYPSRNDLQNAYLALRNGESVDYVIKVLNVSRSQYNYWLKQGKRFERKKNRGEKLTREEFRCYKLKSLSKVAYIRKKGWE